MDDSIMAPFADLDYRMALLVEVAQFMLTSVMVFGGVIPYVPQYYHINRTLNADGFSLYVCLTLQIANTLRIIFWFGHPFELPLLVQSIVMNLAMYVMINLCVKVKNKTELVPSKPRTFLEDMGDTYDKNLTNSLPFSPRTFWDFDLHSFWNWTDFLSYVEFMATFTALTGIFMYFFINVSFVVEAVGYAALITESMLAMPQFYMNQKKRSTSGMSIKMVILWTCGDSYKLLYFFFKGVPIQFIVCGCIQLCLDLAIFLQFLIFHFKASPIQMVLKGIHHLS